MISIEKIIDLATKIKFHEDQAVELRALLAKELSAKDPKEPA